MGNKDTARTTSTPRVVPAKGMKGSASSRLEVEEEGARVTVLSKRKSTTTLLLKKEKQGGKSKEPEKTDSMLIMEEKKQAPPLPQEMPHPEGIMGV